MSSDTPIIQRLFPTFAGLIGNLGWPILQRQLRADFRRNRFFVAQLICLGALGLTLIAVMTVKVEDKASTAPQIGRYLFNLFFAVEYLIILVVFPAFSSTAFTDERSGGTMDLLLISTLRPAEIVWGKFLASAVYCTMFVVASIPLLSVAFLFGGVRLIEVFAAYAILLGLTLLVSMLGICVSSFFTGNLRSTLSVYALMSVALGWSLASISETSLSPDRQGPSILTLLVDAGGDGLPLRLARILLLGTIAFALFFVVAANRLRPASHDRSSALRILTLISISAFVAIEVLTSIRMEGTGRSPPGRNFTDTVVLAAFLLCIVALVFPTEEPSPSWRVRRRFRALVGPSALGRIFSPGAFWGTVYTIALALLVSCGLLVAWHSSFADASDPITARRTVDSLLTLPPYIAAFASLGFLLSTLDFAPPYARLTVFFVFLITLLLPVIFMVSETADSIWTMYYLSPATLWASLDPLPPDAMPRYVLHGIHVIPIARASFAAIAVVLFATAASIARKKGYPLASFGRDVRRERRAEGRRTTRHGSADQRSGDGGRAGSSSSQTSS